MKTKIVTITSQYGGIFYWAGSETKLADLGLTHQFRTHPMSGSPAYYTRITGLTRKAIPVEQIRGVINQYDPRAEITIEDLPSTRRGS